jgi:hypothetical protein
MSTMSLVHATIINCDHPSVHVECMFNPTEYTISKQNFWTAGTSKGDEIGLYEFSSGQACTLQMQLFFDTYFPKKSKPEDMRDKSKPKDVREKYTNKIWRLMEVDPKLPQVKGEREKKGRPPRVRFQWGSTKSFVAVIVELKERLTYFLSDGTPVRSTLDVTFQQIEAEGAYPSTNPTSGGVGGERIYTVNEGDTLGWIAYQVYGNEHNWRIIADANEDKLHFRVRKLRAGTVLEIPNV